MLGPIHRQSLGFSLCPCIAHSVSSTTEECAYVPIWAAYTLSKLLPCSLGGWGEEKPCVVFVASQSTRITS